jgi:hypothetical protein
MLHQLRNLNQQEMDLLAAAPVWVMLLIACADQNIEEKEVNRGKEIIRIKSYAEKSDVRLIYSDLETQMDVIIDEALKSLSADGAERIKFISGKLEELNDVLVKIERSFAIQFYNSLRDLAIYVAQASDSFFGVNAINKEEKKYIKLPMLRKP